MDVINKPHPNGVYVAVCYGLGCTENVTDFLNMANQEGLVSETVKEGPRIKNVTRQTLQHAIRRNGDVPYNSEVY